MKKNKSKTVVVKVTALDIKNGTPGHGDSCPIALALGRYKDDLRACRKPASWDVDTLGIDLAYEDMPSHINIPAKAKKFIERFDAEMPVKPFSFRIRL